jgi:hypothetical protein
LPGKEKFKLFLLIGQSNMAGRGKIEEQDRQPHPRVLTLNKDGEWVPAVDPIHFDKPRMCGVGLGSTFGRQVSEALPDQTIGLIPCAVGGTSIDQWAKGGALFQEAVRRAKLGLKDGHLGGILWHQGETGSNPATYGEKAAQLFAAFRAEFEAPQTPVIIGGLGEFCGPSAQLNPVLRNLPEKVPHSAFADPKGLIHKGDGLHFNSEALREFGRRYAQEWFKLAKVQPPGQEKK